MLLQAGEPPTRGCYVEIVRQGYVIVGRVIWSKEHKFGIQIRDRLNVQALLREIRGGAPAGPEPHRLPKLVESRFPPPARANVEQKAEANRHVGNVLQFAFALVGGTFAAIFIASAVYEGLTNIFLRVSESLH